MQTNYWHRVMFTMAFITCSVRLVTAEETAAVAPKAPRVVEPFPLERVRVTGGPFRHAQDLDVKYLLSLEPDRLLAWFRKEAGLAPKGEAYGGWEQESLAGHSLGHYLTACSLAYKATDDDEFKKKVDYIVSELAEVQKANGNGYLGAIPKGKEMWAQVKAGEIIKDKTANFSLNGVWSPWYTMHKLYAGLIDAYRLCGNELAKDVVVKYANWAYDTTAHLNDETIQKMLACEFGGMNESMAEMYEITGDDRYLDLAKRVFYHHAVFDPIAAGEDKLAGIHSNTQVPKMIGLERMYEATGDQKYSDMAKFFWTTVLKSHTYANGGNSSAEYFGKPGKLSTRLAQTTETCNTYNMLKLTRDLFMHDPQAEYFNYYERALWNHILAHQHPATGMFVYKGFLEPGAVKEFSKPTEDFWCCVGSGMENHVKYNDSIYFRSTRGDPTIYVNQFIPSDVNWFEQQFKLLQTSELPFGDRVRLRVDVPAPVELTIKIRKPTWLAGPMSLDINGESREATADADGYITLKDTWQVGDRIEMTMPMALRTEPMPDDPNMVAFFYGPILMCADMGPVEKLEAGDAAARARIEPVPTPLPPKLVVSQDKLVSSFKPIPGKRLNFEAAGIARVDGAPLKKPKNFGALQTIELVPHYGVADDRYSVYLTRLDPDGWTRYVAAIDAEEKRIAAMEDRKIDALAIGDEDSEREHNLGRKISYSGESNGRRWRDARPGGFFEFDLKVLPNVPMELQATYRGSETSKRTFEIVVDGLTIATQVLDMDTTNFQDVFYDIPIELTRGKDKVRIRFNPYQTSSAGFVYGTVRMLKKN
jgi:DUF1680 family protein